MSSKTTQCELEKKIFEYKLKELTAWKKQAYIIEVNGKTVCFKNDRTMVLSNAPFPTEFSSVEMHQVKKIVTGIEPKVVPVRDWYKEQLKRLTQLVLIKREEAI